MALALSIVWLIAVIYLIAHALRQRGAWPAMPPRPPDGDDLPSVAVIVPTRNESANIKRCLTSVIAQDYPRLTIHVVDDDSSDNTVDIVAGLAREDPRLTLQRSPPLPPGWSGKVNACWQGAAPLASDWLCFLDADMWGEPLLIASAVHAARTGNLDCLSLSPRHELIGFAERLMIPCGLYVLSFSQDLKQDQAEDSGDVTVTGQFMLIRRAAYARVGGHAAVSGAICEDYELAALLKQAGYRVILQDGTKLLSTRMYTGWRELWPGIAKNLVHMMGGPFATAVGAVIALLLAWTAVLLPIADAIGCARGASQSCIALAPAAAASAATFAFHVAGARYFTIPLWYGLLFPLGYSVGALLALDSLRQRLTGCVRWKGRVYQ